MKTDISSAAPPGRFLVRLGIALVVLPPLACAILVASHYLLVPWYIPILASVAFLCMAAAFLQRRSLGRFVGVLLIGLFAGVEWYFMLVMTALPPYTGPVTVGKPFPTFQTMRADGTSFSQNDLHGDQATVFTFFRGRW